MLSSLTICVPTYNRCAELAVAIDSIAAYLGSEVSVAVADNASTDGTRELCEEYQRKGAFRQFTYFRWESNQGADLNYLKAVELSTSEFCMLMGSDDALMPDAKELINNALRHSPDVMLFGRAMYCKDLKTRLKDEAFWVGLNEKRFSLSTDRDYSEYFATCRSLAGVFSYLSVILFRRECWTLSQRVSEFVGTAYVHVAALFEGMRARPACLLQVDSKPLVKCRTGNDSFLKSGHLKRFLLDWDGYEKLARIYFPSDQRSLTQILGRECTLKCLVVLRYDLIKRRDSSGVRRVCERLKGSNWGTNKLWPWRVTSLIPYSVLHFAFLVRQKRSKMRSAVVHL